MPNIQQRYRQENIIKVSKWVKEAGGTDKINTSELVRKCILILGCTRERALEYIFAATGVDMGTKDER